MLAVKEFNLDTPEQFLTEVDGQLVINEQAVDFMAEKIKAVKPFIEAVDSMKEALKEAMAQANVTKLETKHIKASYTPPSTTVRFDSTTFKKDHRDLYDEYCKVSPKKAVLRLTECTK